MSKRDFVGIIMGLGGPLALVNCGWHLEDLAYGFALSYLPQLKARGEAERLDKLLRPIFEAEVKAKHGIPRPRAPKGR
jgi:hypothetical protein